MNYHRIDIDFVNSNPDCIIIPSDPLSDYLNYYNAYVPDKELTYIRQYRTILYKNIYPGIDLEFLTNEKTRYKYNFVIHPGGKPSDIKLRVQGPDQIFTNGKDLKSQTRFGDILELIPNSYIIFEGIKVNIQACFKKLAQGLFGFAVDEDLPLTSTIVIDPTSTRLWGTYYGGSNGDYGIRLSADSSHNVYMCGYTYSTNNIATAGAYQTTKIGIQNGFLVKFNAAGVRQWGTYYGGDITGSEQIGICATDINGNIYVAGLTSADSGIATPGAHQEIYGGGLHDAFLAKFNTNGIRLWATYYGGEGDDIEWYALCCDKLGTVYIGGGTTSLTNISTPGSYQEIKNGNSDAFLAKFDSSGVRIWGTYYGGNNDDQFNSCSIDTMGNVYCCGQTNSTDNISSPGAFQTIYGGDPEDAFLVVFNSSGQRLWGTYYGGEQQEQSYFCINDPAGFVYLTGYSSSTSGIASRGVFNHFWQEVRMPFLQNLIMLGREFGEPIMVAH